MIDIYMMEQLKTFAECGTLSAAAEILNTSQPSLTRSMKRMEDELGVSLFTRTKNHLGLTETGKMAAAYAAQLLSVSQEFESNQESVPMTEAFIRWPSAFVHPYPKRSLLPSLTTLSTA